MPDISKIKAPDNTVYNLLSKKTKGVIRCETDSTSTATAFKVTVSGITELYDGLTLLIKNTKIASASGCTLKVNDLAAKRIIRSNGGGYVTTHWALNATYLFVYSGTNAQWEMQQGYWADNNTWRSIKVNGTALLGTGTSTGAINFVSGDNVTLTGSGNNLTIAATDTTYESKTAASGGTAVSLCTTGEKYTWNNKMDSTNPTGTGYFSLNRKASTTVGTDSFAEGYNTTASGDYSHAEGYSTSASGDYSHAEGSNTIASASYAHAEGNLTNATGQMSHAEGRNTAASGDYSHAEGYLTKANHKSQHVFGEFNIEDPSSAAATARGNYVEIVGNGTSSSARSNARTLDWDGNETLAGSLTVGTTLTVNGVAFTDKMDATNPTGTGYFSLNRAANTTIGDYSFAEGSGTTASGICSHAEGDHTTASGSTSHAEGDYTQASGAYSHAEGSGAIASGDYSHAEGGGTVASGDSSHAEGAGTIASGACSHAEGFYTTSNHAYQHVFGNYNIIDPSSADATARGNYIEIVGNGTSSSARSNARTLDWDGNETLAGNLSLANRAINVIEADNDVSSDTFTRLLFTDVMTTTADYGITSLSSEAQPNGRTNTWLNCRNYDTNGAVVDNNYLRLYVDKDGTTGVSLSHPTKWLDALGIRWTDGKSLNLGTRAYGYITSDKKDIDIYIPLNGLIIGTFLTNKNKITSLVASLRNTAGGYVNAKDTQLVGMSGVTISNPTIIGSGIQLKITKTTVWTSSSGTLVNNTPICGVVTIKTSAS